MAKRRNRGRSAHAQGSVARDRVAPVEPLESRTLLSTFSNADLNGTLNLFGMNTTGTVVADGNGNFTGGAFTNADGSTSVPTGTYSLSPSGALTISSDMTNIGGVNSSKNVAPISSTTGNNNLGVLVSTGSATFSDADLSGTWYEFDNGESGPPDDYPTNDSDNSGHATLVFDGKGNFTYTHSEDESGKTETGPGTYSVSADGAVNIVITPTSGGGGNGGNGSGNNFTGVMNSSKDFVATDETSLAAAATSNNSRMLVLVKASGVYSDADMDGTWTFCNDTGYGTITFDGTGTFNGQYTGQFATSNGGSGIQTVSVTGPYSVSADGNFTGTPTATGQTVPVVPISGWINASRNVFVYDKPDSGEEGLDDLTIAVNSATPLGATVSLQSSSASISPGQSVTLTATVTPILGGNNTVTGSVNFLDGATLIGNAAVQPDGTASLTTPSLAVGPNSITASYSGDTTFTAAASSSTSVLDFVPEAIGQLDPTFGTKGLASHDTGFTSTDGVAQDGTQSILAGTVGTAPAESFGVTRYNADGSLDTTFGTGGLATTGFGGTDDVPAAVDVLASGQILVAGTATTYASGVASGSEFAVVEYNADGSLDTSFGSGTGQVLVSFSNTPGTLSNDLLNSLILGSGGMIYLGGASGADFAMAALNADGTLDTGFGTGGKVLQSFGAGSAVANSLALQPNGDIVAAGSATAGGITEIALARFSTAGILDPRFGTKGLVTANVRGVDDSASSVVIQANGQIVIGGSSATGSGASLSTDFVVARYSSAGKLDRTFGSGGTAITSFGQPSAITQLVLQANGQIVASGKTASNLTNIVPSQLSVAVARYTLRGALDTTFNGTGETIINLAGTGGTERPLIEPLDASGLGTQFDQFTASHQGVVSVTPGGAILDAGSSGLNTVEAKLITAGVDLVASLLTQPPAAIIGGAKGTVSVQIIESGTNVAAGTITIEVEIATDAQGDGATTVKSLPEKISLRQQQRRSYKVAFVFPQNLTTGSYYLIANVQNGSAPALQNLNPLDELSASKSAITIAPPLISLQASGLSAGSTFVPGKPALVIFTVTNDGNTPAKGTTTADLILSTDQTAADGTPFSNSKLPVSLPANKSKLYRLSIKLPTTLVAGTYYLIAVIDPVDSLGVIDNSDSTVVDTTQLVVG